jgi:hypothetical protein
MSGAAFGPAPGFRQSTTENAQAADAAHRLPVARSRVTVITQRFTVEFDRRTVGIAVRVPGGFMFYASDDRFRELDGQAFPRARKIERALSKAARKQRRPLPASARAAAFA